MSTKVSIGTVQPIALKWTSFLFIAGFCSVFAIAFIRSGQPDYWIALVMLTIMLTWNYFQLLNTVNVYLSGSHFLIEHAIKGTITKDFGLFRTIESSLLLPHKIVFSDGSHYYFSASLTGLWKAFSQDSQGYANYVRGLMKAQIAGTGLATAQ